ncbi:aminopeptidase [Nocardioides sp. Root1257]|uniref:aminopeptidase N n=1 Tax=unclassified Nocardioides TaxID=2615069 RepID=UPI0007016E3C|nr:MULTISPECIES: aminopeptidase N [unclassified Nocardioides]KQW48847.1 aminopeptidase [Nocardioides sp. Root1257]KRC48022.1 aminopeptidase [Nocardioides sp. Root224]
MSLTLAEARARAAQLSEVAYDVALDVTDHGSPTFGSRTTVRFGTSGPETFLELADARDLSVVVDGTPEEPAYDGRRIQLTGLPTDRPVEVVVDARLPYVTDGDGMHRTVDPADGETYVAAYLGMDVAQKVFACFDQNDLKAPVTTSVAADPRWTVLANGRPVDDSPADGRWRFATTPPIPVALLIVAAGPWASRRWEHAGLPFGWHARASLSGELERDFAELRQVTEDCYDHYATMFDEPYAFDSYDQVFVPGLNWGAQEMPGCVSYRDELLPRGQVPEDVRVFRASVIAHEMSHMWFGDLMTMTWWEDTWLQESFADYMGYRVAGDAAGFGGALVAHEIAGKPGAYDADARRSTHPVAPDPEDLPDVDAAATIFDAISYAKGNSVLRQLATWLGDEVFLAGVNTHLTRHRFANATLADFVDALDEASDRDVRSWVEQWLRSTGFDTIRVERDGDVPVLHRDGTRAHRVRVTAYDDVWTVVGSELVDLADDPVPLPAYAGRVVVPNAHGETFARIELDVVSAAAVDAGLCRIEDDLVRAVLWTMLLDRVQTRALTADDLVDVLERHLPGEGSATIVTSILNRTLSRVLPLRAPAAAVGDLLERVAATCGTGLLHATSPELALAFADGVAAGSHDVESLRAWVDAGTVGQLPLPPTLRWRVVRRLAELGATDAAAIEEERARVPGTEAEVGAAAALASLPTASAKATAWSVVTDPDVDNRTFGAAMGGLWSAEQADLVAPYVERYLAEAPGWAARGQAFAQVVGRARPTFLLTDAQVALLDGAVAGDLPTVLRRQWEDWLDDVR